MKSLAAVPVIIALLACSCASLIPKEKSLSNIKADLVCVPYEKGMRWDTVYGELGQDPDIIAQSESGGDPNKYVRGYKKMTVILNVEQGQLQEGKKFRYPEIVTGLELCRKK